MDTMRTKIKPLDFDEGDWFEMDCPYEFCRKPTFYTKNIRAEYCCDGHRTKAYKMRIEPQNEIIRTRNNQFKMNAAGLKKLYSKGITNPTNKDLDLVDFNQNNRGIEKETKDGQMAFLYFDYYLIIKKNGTFEIGKK